MTQEQLDAMLSDAERTADGDGDGENRDAAPDAGAGPDADAESGAETGGGEPTALEDPSPDAHADAEPLDAEAGSFQSIEQIGADPQTPREPAAEPAPDADANADVLAEQVQEMLDQAVAEQQARDDTEAADREATGSMPDAGEAGNAGDGGDASNAADGVEPETDELSDEAALIAQIDQMLAEGGDPPPAAGRADDRGMQQPAEPVGERPAPAANASAGRPDDVPDEPTTPEQPGGFDFAAAIESAGRADDTAGAAASDPDDDEADESSTPDPGSAEAVAAELDADADPTGDPDERVAPVAGDMASMDDLLAASAEERLDAEEQQLQAWDAADDEQPSDPAPEPEPADEPLRPTGDESLAEPREPQPGSATADTDPNPESDRQPRPSLGERLYRLCARINQPLSNVPAVWRDVIGCIGLSFVLCAAVLLIGAILGAVVALALFVPLLSGYTAVVYLLIVRRSRSTPTPESDSS